MGILRTIGLYVKYLQPASSIMAGSILMVLL